MAGCEHVPSPEDCAPSCLNKDHLPSQDRPPKPTSFDDFISRDELAAFFGVKPGTINKWVYEEPPLPYIKFKNRRYFTRPQVVWWMNKMQEMPDQAHLMTRGALRRGEIRGTH